MAYRGGSQIDFTIDSSFQPFSMQEMLVPFTAYKDAFEKTEEAYLELSDKSDKFKYLSEQLPEGSKARQIYEGYANTLASQAEDLARNGLSMGNRRALTSLKRRYSGEIGRLDKAQTALEKEQALRREMGLKDSSMLYAANNFNIDDFLDGNTPNLYGISGNDLYTRGATLGKSMSSRITSAGDAGSVINGYYRDFVSKVGVSQASIGQFMQSQPVQQMVDNILMANGVTGNLTGNELARARQQILNGIYDGIVYQESHNPQRDPGVPGWSDLDQSRRGWAGLEQSERHFQQEMAYKRAALAASIDDATGKKISGKGKGKGSGSGDGSNYFPTSENGVLYEWDDRHPSGETNEPKASKVPSDVEEYPGTITPFEKLPQYAKDIVMKHVGAGNVELYDIYFQKYKDRSFIVGDDKPKLMIIPKPPKVYNPVDYTEQLNSIMNE